MNYIRQWKGQAKLGVYAQKLTMYLYQEITQSPKLC